MNFKTAGTIVLCAWLAAIADAGEDTHNYVDGEPVVLWLSKVGPYHNPQEVYSYYALPFCRPSTKLTPETRIGGLGEILEGSELQNSDIPITFKEDLPRSTICRMTLNDEDTQLLAYAVSNHYWYQMFIDELPVWGMVGEIVADPSVITELESHTDKPHGIADLTYLYTHKNFTISYNGDNIIEISMTSEESVMIEAGKVYELSYSVHWVPTDKTFDRRFDRYLDNNFFEHQIHWFSLFNSFMMVVFLCGLVALILMRTLKADYARYTREEDGDLETTNAKSLGDESGWKLVHADVFRLPPHIILYTAVIGTGTQLLLLALIVIVSAFAGSLYVDRGAVTKAAIIAYSLTSAVSGFISGKFYRSYFLPNEAPRWTEVMLLTASLFPGLAFATLFLLNIIAWLYATTNALTLLTIAKIFVLWAFISLPLNICGTIFGRRFAAPRKLPTRVNPMVRPIPDKPWYSSPWAVILASGLLPFGSIFIETYFVFSSFWNYKFYYVYGFMLVVFTILAIVVSCVTIVATYFWLNSEDHRWPWHSFLAGASPAIYVFVYAIYYFIFRTEMSGLLQTAFYFGYTLIGCGALGIMTGTIGTLSAGAFVRMIFSNIKVD